MHIHTDVHVHVPVYTSLNKKKTLVMAAWLTNHNNTGAFPLKLVYKGHIQRICCTKIMHIYTTTVIAKKKKKKKKRLILTIPDIGLVGNDSETAALGRGGSHLLGIWVVEYQQI